MWTQEGCTLAPAESITQWSKERFDALCHTKASLRQTWQRNFQTLLISGTMILNNVLRVLLYQLQLNLWPCSDNTTFIHVVRNTSNPHKNEDLPCLNQAPSMLNNALTRWEVFTIKSGQTKSTWTRHGVTIPAVCTAPASCDIRDSQWWKDYIKSMLYYTADQKKN